MTDRLANLEQKLADQASELAELRGKLTPAPKPPDQAPHDYSIGLSMPKSVLCEMAAAGDPRTLVKDFRKGRSLPSSMTAPPAGPRQSQRRSNGWVDSTPLGPPPGDKIIQELVEAQNVRDRAARGR